MAKLIGLAKMVAKLIGLAKMDIDIVRLILEQKDVDVNTQNKTGHFALKNACVIGRCDIVKLLLEQKDIDINIQGYWMNQNALMSACFHGKHEVVKLLLARGSVVSLSYKTNFSCSYKLLEILNNRRTYLPRWNRFTTYKYYPKEFNRIAFQWLLVCRRFRMVKRFHTVSKDMKYLLLEYIAEMWKKQNIENIQNIEPLRKKSRNK